MFDVRVLEQAQRRLKKTFIQHFTIVLFLKLNQKSSYSKYYIYMFFSR